MNNKINQNKVKYVAETLERLFAIDESRACVSLEVLQDLTWFTYGQNDDSYINHAEIKQVVKDTDWQLQVLEQFKFAPHCDTGIPVGLVVFRDAETYEDYMSIPNNYTEYKRNSDDPFFEDDFPEELDNTVLQDPAK